MNVMHIEKKVRCTLDEPIQKLMEKLASKSPELYIFWQNYNQLYSLYSEKLNEAEALKVQNQQLRARPVSNPTETQMFKQRQFKLERQFEDLRQQNDRLRQKLNEAQLNNHRLVEENISFDGIIRQFKDENHIQKQNIDNILARLRQSQSNAKVSSQSKYMMEQQVIQLRRSQTLTGDLKRQLADKDSQILLLTAAIEDYKRQFQRILTEAVRNCKIRLCESLPDIVQASKVTTIQKTPITVINNI